MMYNRYIFNDEEVFEDGEFEEKFESTAKQPNCGASNGISGIFEQLKLPKISLDLIVLIAIAYFLLDGNEDNDILVIVGILALLGL